ncbi:arylesterase [Celerinatantimonas diazotrophica]|uniref:Acyl-CoA thioesterase-1 n=1 Tax=Celerinatantimonas diazotrophica TaxID=412034 RepID=A0A4R1JLK5_9GAMM|nr:arylesterase [Celerinatantimonas diazotrophica]TCK51913.1 acyl-CoA thioesterase-1 [Celerinatantimonas diazotrophica]CAG9296391.1 Thioesterase 1/protease 1/lysophospholipase L1 [Celerinatantimonas diazotrophica]
MLWNVQTFAATTTTLLILGDSLSAGHRMNVSQSWPTLLQEKLPNVRIINASSSGETSSGGVRRLPGLLAKYHPNWCFLELGGNDGLQGLAPKFLKTQLTKMIQQASQAQCHVILSEIKIPPNYGKRYTESFNQVYHQLAHQFKLPLMPFFVEPIYQQKGMMQADGIHPSVKAQPVIANEVAKFLKPIMAERK